ncbi:MAG: hypothetical protein V3U60_11320 [Gammaproteobacteria bacterium]
MVRLALIAFILTAVITAGWKTYAAIDQAAYTRAELDFREGLDAIKEKAAEDALDDYKAAQAVAGAQIDDEIQIEEKIRIVEREVPKIIEKIVEIKPECSNLPELGVLFSAQAEASNSRAADLADDSG